MDGEIHWLWLSQSDGGDETTGWAFSSCGDKVVVWRTTGDNPANCKGDKMVMPLADARIKYAELSATGKYKELKYGAGGADE